MPHIVIEHSNNLNDEVKETNLCEKLYNLVADSGLFSQKAVKARSISYDNYVLAEGYDSFIHVTISILSGRDTVQRKALSDSAFELIKRVSKADSVSVNLHEMNKETYNK